MEVGPIPRETKESSYEGKQEKLKEDQQRKIKDLAIYKLKEIIGWREVDMPEGDRVKHAITYMEDRAREAIEEITRLDYYSKTSSEVKGENMTIDGIRNFNKQLEETIQAVKQNYLSHKIYVESKEELENLGFRVPKIVRNTNKENKCVRKRFLH